MKVKIMLMLYKYFMFVLYFVILALLHKALLDSLAYISIATQRWFIIYNWPIYYLLLLNLLFLAYFIKNRIKERILSY